MHHWQMVPFEDERPTISADNAREGRPRLEAMVADHVSRILSFYGQIETMAAEQIAEDGTSYTADFLHLVTDPVDLQDDWQITVSQLPYIGGRTLVEPGRHAITIIDEDDLEQYCFAVTDTTVPAQPRILHANNTSPTTEEILELIDALHVIETNYLGVHAERNNPPLVPSLFPVQAPDIDTELLTSPLDL